MFIRQTKNDTQDALIVAEVIRFGRYCETQVAPESKSSVELLDNYTTPEEMLSDAQKLIDLLSKTSR